MKNQSMTLKILGGVFLAILCVALYDISDQIFNQIIDKKQTDSSIEYKSYFYNYAPYLILSVFFIFLKIYYPVSKLTNYAFVLGLVAIGMMLISGIFQYLYETKAIEFDTFNDSNSHNPFEERESIIEKKAETLDSLSRLVYYFSYGKLLLVFAFVFAADILRKNKKVIIALFLTIFALLFQYVHIGADLAHYASVSYEKYKIAYSIFLENSSILLMLKQTLLLISFAYLFTSFAKLFQGYTPNIPQDSQRNKLKPADWVVLGGVAITTILFFCNWIDNDFDDAAHKYLTLGCHTVPFAAIGLMIMPIAAISTIENNNIGKKISAIAMIIWPFIVGIATWEFDVYEGRTVGDILIKGNDMSEIFMEKFMEATHILSIVGYTLFSIITGVLLLLDTLPKNPQKRYQSMNIERSDSYKNEEITKLKAEIERLKNQIGSQEESEQNS